MSNYEKRAKRGIKFLDKKGPEGWRELLSLQELNLADTKSCVLGQIFKNDARREDYFSGYSYALDDILVNKDIVSIARLGFERKNSNESFNDLTEAWKKVLSE